MTSDEEAVRLLGKDRLVQQLTQFLAEEQARLADLVARLEAETDPDDIEKLTAMRDHVAGLVTLRTEQLAAAQVGQP